MNLSLESIISELSEFSLPAWQEIPDIELYMDQVLSLVERYLRTEKNADEKLLTSSMVNNYVKYRIIPPPTAKKYTRSHVACLLMLCLLKPLLSTAEIRQLFSAAGAEGIENLYGSFREILKTTAGTTAKALQKTSDDAAEAVLYSVLRARAEQTVAVRLLAMLAPEENET